MNKQTIRTLDALTEHGLIDERQLPEMQQVVDHFSLAITEEMHRLIDVSNPNDPIAKQFVPSTEELNFQPDERIDPIGDDAHRAVKGIIHRYPDRCLFAPVHVCPVYCRFCFRREKIGEGSETLHPQELEAAFSYLEQHQEIWEVILTGGDPLILKPAFLQKIISRLCDIKHIDVIRIHTRVPVVDPSRINAEMVSVLKCQKTVYVVLHANHPSEFTSAARDACAMLVDAGIPMLSQTVLLKNVNDNIDVLSELMRCFIRHRIKPYYLHQGDLARGTQHFRTSIEAGRQLMQALRGRFSGICQPTYVLDIPGGYGKVPIGPDYLETEEESYLVTDYCGNKHHYPA